jgi:hypothetical protein
MSVPYNQPKLLPLSDIPKDRMVLLYFVGADEDRVRGVPNTGPLPLIAEWVKWDHFEGWASVNPYDGAVRPRPASLMRRARGWMELAYDTTLSTT